MEQKWRSGWYYVLGPTEKVYLEENPTHAEMFTKLESELGNKDEEGAMNLIWEVDCASEQEQILIWYEFDE